VAQDHAQQRRASVGSILRSGECSLSEVDLSFLARFDLEAAEGKMKWLTKRAHESLHRLVAAVELVVAEEILEDPLRAKPEGELLFDELPMGLAKARSARGPGGRNGRF
jgi:hypothetical protein